MRHVELPDGADLAQWRDAARTLLGEGVPPEHVLWQGGAQADLLGTAPGVQHDLLADAPATRPTTVDGRKVTHGLPEHPPGHAPAGRAGSRHRHAGGVLR